MREHPAGIYKTSKAKNSKNNIFRLFFHFSKHPPTYLRYCLIATHSTLQLQLRSYISNYAVPSHHHCRLRNHVSDFSHLADMRELPNVLHSTLALSCTCINVRGKEQPSFGESVCKTMNLKVKATWVYGNVSINLVLRWLEPLVLTWKLLLVYR